MADENFRLRKSISADEIGPGNDADNMAKAHQLQRSVGVSVGGEDDGIPEPKSHMPPALQHALRQQKLAKQQEMMEEESVDTVFDRPTGASGPRLAKTGNARVDDILDAIKNTYQWEEIVLPSRGKFYDGKVAPKNGTLHVRQMTGDEQAILSTIRFIRQGKAMNMIFSNCVREKIKPEELLVVDRTYLMIYLRIISMGGAYEVNVRCPECDHKFETVIDLDEQIQPLPCPDDFGPANLSDELPTTKFKFTYRLPTSADEQLISDYRDKQVKKWGENRTDDTWFYRASVLLEELEGLTDQDDIFNVVRRLPINDVAYLQGALSDPPFGVDTKCDILCASCDRGFKIELPMESSFFFPKRKKESHTPA